MTLFSWAVVTTVGLGAATCLLYQFYLHPAWRRQRKIMKACRSAFGAENYRLVRIRLHPSGPSGMDLFSFSHFGSSVSKRYFTYRIETTDADPDLSGLSSEEAKLVQHYLDRIEKSPHYGKTVLLPEHESISIGRGGPS
jgi:hypothetical protein